METAKIIKGNSFTIGQILVEPGRNVLSHGSDVYLLEPKIMDVLEYLAVHQGRVCSRDDIIAAVWKVEYGADESLTRAISVIRKTFRQAGGRGQYIQTVSKRGYSLQEPVASSGDSKPKRTTLVEGTLKASSLARKKEIAVPTLVAPEVSNASIELQQPKPKYKSLGLIFALIAVAGAATLAWQGPQQSETFRGEFATTTHGRSVAVMPFVDLSMEKNHEYFSYGIAEELSSELRKISNLRVVAQPIGGAISYNNMSYQEVGEKLKVSHIIIGSVRKQGDKVRITPQLINSEDNSYVWSANYNGTLDDIFELQQSVASNVALELSLALSLNISEPVFLERDLLSTFAPDSQ